MKRNRKILIAVLLATVVLAGSISGIALAADGDDDGSFADRFGDLFERTGQIYQEKTGTSIDADILQESFSEASDEILPEIGRHFDQRFFGLCDLTEEELEEMEGWLESRPEFPTEEFKDWMESRPEGFPFGRGTHGHGRHFFRFERLGGEIHGWCLSEAPAE